MIIKKLASHPLLSYYLSFGEGWGEAGLGEAYYKHMKKVVIAGGTGFIGKYLTKRFQESGYEVLIVSRLQGNISWEHTELTEALNSAELVINLAGKSINCRHNQQNKKALIESRINPTIKLGKAIQSCEKPPKLWLNASATGIYKPSENTAQTEDTTEPGSDFLADLVMQWETAFFRFKLNKTRQIALRTSVVLGKNGGALKPLLLLSKLGLGGKQASGDQIFSWIHIEDYFRIILFAIENQTLMGVINATSPEPVKNKVLMKSIRKNLAFMPVGLPAPAFAIKIGAAFINTESSLILNSSFVIPKRLIEAGFTFLHPTISEALSDILSD